MRVYKQYVITEKELRDTINECNRDLIGDTFDPDVFIDMIIKNPKRLNESVLHVLSDCDVMMLDSTQDFRDLAETFLEHWSCFALCCDLVRDYEKDPTMDFDVVLVDNSNSNRIVFNKTELLNNY